MTDIAPVVQIMSSESTDGTITAKRRQYTYPADSTRGLGEYVDSLDLMGEWDKKSVADMDAEMTARYDRWTNLILNPAPAPAPAPVDPQAANAALTAAAAALDQAQAAIAALLPAP